MSATPTVIADPAPVVKTQKLRSSCEDCGSAKVKCDRGQPRCSRCSTLRLDCVYGISRRTGKPARKRLNAHLAKTNDFPCKKRIANPAGNQSNNTTIRLEPSDSVDRSVQPNASVTDNMPVPASINKISDINQQDQPELPSMNPFYINDWPQLDIWGTAPDFSCFSGLENQLPAAPLESFNSASANFDSPESHSCPRGSYELFRDLICPGPFLHAPKASSNTVSAQLDQVLQFNRNAIDRLNRLLKCPCAKSGHRVMVHASIISRILIWYQQAGWTGSDSSKAVPTPTSASSPTDATSTTSLPSGESSDTDTTSSPVLVQTTGFAVEQVLVSVGDFNIEDQSLQAAIRCQLVLSELRNVSRLIDRFASQEHDESSAHGVTNLYSHLGVWLHGEHSRTVKVLRDRLIALNKILEL